MENGHIKYIENVSNAEVIPNVYSYDKYWRQADGIGGNRLGKMLMKEIRCESDLTNIGTWLMDHSDRYYRYWIYKRFFTPYEMEQKFSDESIYEDSARHGFISEAIELPDGDVLLGFDDPLISEDYMEYYRLSEIRLAYNPDDYDDMRDELGLRDDDDDSMSGDDEFDFRFRKTETSSD